MKKRGKKGLLYGAVIFILLVLVFFVAMFVFVGMVGEGTNIKEQAYAKQIALLIDQAKPGTTLEINVAEFYKEAEKNKVEKLVYFKYDENKVVVRLDQGKGYSYGYFTKLDSASVDLDETNKILKIKI